VDFPERSSEFWFGGKLFDSVAGSTPFGAPLEKRHLGYTYKTRDEIRSYMARHMAPEFSREKYDVLTHNCNHFSDALCLFLHNAHIPDDVVNQAEMVMSTLTARALRPLLNQWLGGFGGADGAAAQGSQVDDCLQDEVLPGAIVEFCRAEGGRPLVGEILEASAESCTVRCLDYWQRGASEWSVPFSLVLQVLTPAPVLPAKLLPPRSGSERAVQAAVCSWMPLPCLLCSRPGAGVATESCGPRPEKQIPPRPVQKTPP